MIVVSIHDVTQGRWHNSRTKGLTRGLLAVSLQLTVHSSQFTAHPANLFFLIRSEVLQLTKIKNEINQHATIAPGCRWSHLSLAVGLGQSTSRAATSTVLLSTKAAKPDSRGSSPRIKGIGA